ncbi:MAG: DNA primase [Candidatus Komeilibacteria bacterium RIFOXYC1_FULL_37_11]|uniref:DNA primase n=1 Tax=Candidatus Komeilibacteria bacterium RIFOXYC1_FULL_37_11 TaxID=1798555 RepID=A0A1G2BY74_9BACT|nr:MAG: DNA primase [Candidatus Komeilibacteria bacterium RIFOXYC1_FULL_37_11]OGY95240.1 MAG: DNA primase [Candidatus Komeilibacteria bacterium RIFOXYD1_FULL_37_29]OGY95613.1 MAG: DNA primase [Candidatus Komeilibacteria bacterium RIFOXYD2_FULL_37_8]
MNPVEEIKSKLDIVDIISSYINLQSANGNFKAVCPFHNEKTPSFMVSREKQIWHCFGCDKGGDVIGFVQEYEGIDFKEALRILAEKANVPLVNFQSAVKEDNSRLYQINEKASDFFCSILETDSEASRKTLGYLQGRQIKDSSIKEWRLGLSSESWDGLLKHLTTTGYREEDIFKAGLIVKKKDGSGYVDRFRKRLMFPLADTQGRIVAFTSRSLAGIIYNEEEQGGKYVNSPQTAIYDKSKTLYGWHLAKETMRKKKYLIVVEGNMDTIAVHQTSAKNTVAVSGTALTLDHIKLIKRYVNNVILSFDGDAAGSRASFRSIALCWQEDMNVKILVLPKGKDPADVVKDNPDEWLQLIKNSMPVMDYYFKRIFQAIDISRADHKKVAVQKLLPVIKYINKIEQSHYLKKLSEKLSVPLHILEQGLEDIDPFLAKQDEVIQKNVQDKKNSLSLLSEKILIITFFKNQYLEKMITELDPEMISEALQGLYKKVIVYYTKHQNLEKFGDFEELSPTEKEDWIRLVMSGAVYYENFKETDIANDFQNFVSRIKREYLENKRNILIGQLRQAELSDDHLKQDDLSHQINLINKEVYKLQS